MGASPFSRMAGLSFECDEGVRCVGRTKFRRRVGQSSQWLMRRNARIVVARHIIRSSKKVNIGYDQENESNTFRISCSDVSWPRSGRGNRN
jgi:hypothetical protein